MRNDSSSQMRSRNALAATALSELENRLGSTELSSLVSGLLVDRSKRAPKLRLTRRDEQIVELVFRCRALRADQIQTALFTPGNASGCQRRITLLQRNGYLDCLPRASVNEPAVYLLTRRSVKGNRLLRSRWPEDDFQRGLTRLGPLQHLLAVNDVRVRVERACRELRWTLAQWRTPEQLKPLLTSARVIPDGFFQIQRIAEGQLRTASCFLELERVAKSHEVLRSKLENLGRLYYSGEYQQLFGTRALRVLFVFATGHLSARLVSHGRELAAQLGVTIARFATLDHLATQPAVASLTEPLWLAPNHKEPISLFPTTQETSRTANDDRE